ncbi:MAG: protein-glutamate O-methyltransferase [Rhodospirillales bacterium]
MSTLDFAFISGMLKQRSGLIVTQDKMYLLESRLMPIVRKRGMKDLSELISQLKSSRDEGLTQEVIEAMTTNESFFFRDTRPFDIFRDQIMPGLLERNAARRQIRIWCAAASSGQEPYSLAMILKEMSAKISGWRIEIVGTDISREILQKAKAGLYSQFEVQRGLPIQLLVKYFQKSGDLWQIDSSLRGMVQYREQNLLENITGLGKFDVIFCRNVLIYFDQPTKKEVLDRIASITNPDGCLFLGGAETVLGVSDKFKPMAGARGVYIPT